MVCFNNEDCNQDPIDEVDIVDIEGFMAMDEDNCFECQCAGRFFHTHGSRLSSLA